jgi:putative ABC transport system permease protein
MLRSFLILAIRNFFKNRTYSVINIFGLSVGLAAFIMLSLFVKYESSYDTYHKDHERIYMVMQLVNTANEITTWTQLPAPVSVELENKYAEVEEAITIREIWGEYLSSTKERTFYEENGYYANPDIFDLFRINFIAGNKETALDAPMKIVLTETIAKKLFPDVNPIGQNILVDSKRTYQVSAVIEDIPFNSNARPSYLLSFETHKSVFNEDYFEHWDWHGARVYIKLKENVDAKLFESKIKYLLDEFIEDRDEEIQLKPIWMVHLRQGSEDGYWIAILLYGTVGLFTLLLAAINFINLTTAYSLTRAKEIGVKKIVGCSRISLMKQFLGESLIVVFISLLVAFTITEAALPLFNRIVSVPLNIKYIEDWTFTLFIIGITTLTGILSGLYPALVLSSLNPLSTIKNQFFDSNRFKKFSMRKGLVMSILFVITTLGVLGQFNYFQNKDLGFEKQNLLICRTKETEKVKINEFSALRDELLQIPDVEEASISYNTPFYSSWGQTMNWEGAPDGEKINCRYNRAYATFLNTLKIDLLAGRHFDVSRAVDSNACIVNETFVKVAGWSLEEAIGKRVWDLDYTIIGVVKDFHEQSPFTKIKPYFLYSHPGYLTHDKDINIRVADASNKETIREIESILEDFFPESNFEFGLFDENINNGTNKVYAGMAKTFGFFSVVSIVIAIIGLFALVSFSSKRKIKEIGIRKVLGARSIQIYAKLAREYLILIILANLIAIPLGILFGKTDPSYYKQEDNYSQLFWIMILSIVITLLTISIQVIKSARSNPVESLRYE